MRLRVLLIEDSLSDALLLERRLVRAGYEPVLERVDAVVDLRAALARGGWDLIISDYMLPDWSGSDALRIVREVSDDLPFLLVSGAIGEETAIEAIKAGASDYLLKDRLARLPAAIARALEDAELRRERRRSRLAVAFLAEASVQLNASLDPATVAATLVDLVVPALAEAAAVDLVDGAGSLTRAAASQDAAALLASATRGDGPSGMSVATLPLAVRGEPRGVLSLVVPTSPRPFGLGDAALGEELAARAGLALENARLYRQAQDAIAARDEFLMIAAHELRTPLTPLSLQVQTLLRAARATSEPATPRLGTDLEATFRHIERLTRLVDRLLDVTRLGEHGLTIACEEMDLAAVVREVTDGFRAQAAEVGSDLELRVAGPLVGRWDRTRLGQMLANLLSNALKFGAGKPVEVTVAAEDGRARVAVRDHGHGIAAADRERIFERFERAVSVRSYGGFGLGLWVVRQVVAAHGGAIAVASAPGGGTDLHGRAADGGGAGESDRGLTVSSRERGWLASPKLPELLVKRGLFLRSHRKPGRVVGRPSARRGITRGISSVGPSLKSARHFDPRLLGRLPDSAKVKCRDRFGFGDPRPFAVHLAVSLALAFRFDSEV